MKFSPRVAVPAAIVILVFFFAPVVYSPLVVEPYNRFPGYESVSCVLVGIGASYVVMFGYSVSCPHSYIR